MGKINERFTDIADRVSETIGQWWVSAISILVVLIWLASGPLFKFSDTWQLLINTPTTVLEMWLGFLIAAAANRVERVNRSQMERLEALVERIEAMEERVDEVVEGMAKLLEVDHKEHTRLLHNLYSLNEEQMRILKDVDKIRGEVRGKWLV